MFVYQKNGKVCMTSKDNRPVEEPGLVIEPSTKGGGQDIEVSLNGADISGGSVIVYIDPSSTTYEDLRQMYEAAPHKVYAAQSGDGILYLSEVHTSSFVFTSIVTTSAIPSELVSMTCRKAGWQTEIKDVPVGIVQIDQGNCPTYSKFKELNTSGRLLLYGGTFIHFVNDSLRTAEFLRVTNYSGNVYYSLHKLTDSGWETIIDGRLNDIKMFSGADLNGMLDALSEHIMPVLVDEASGFCTYVSHVSTSVTFFSAKLNKLVTVDSNGVSYSGQLYASTSGWTPNKVLGTDSEGDITVLDASSITPIVMLYVVPQQTTFQQILSHVSHGGFMAINDFANGKVYYPDGYTFDPNVSTEFPISIKFSTLDSTAHWEVDYTDTWTQS